MQVGCTKAVGEMAAVGACSALVEALRAGLNPEQEQDASFLWQRLKPVERIQLLDQVCGFPRDKLEPCPTASEAAFASPAGNSIDGLSHLSPTELNSSARQLRKLTQVSPSRSRRYNQLTAIPRTSLTDPPRLMPCRIRPCRGQNSLF